MAPDLDQLQVGLRKLSVALSVRRHAGIQSRRGDAVHDVVALVAEDLDLPLDVVAADIMEMLRGGPIGPRNCSRPGEVTTAPDPAALGAPD